MAWIGRGPGSSGLGAARSARGGGGFVVKATFRGKRPWEITIKDPGGWRGGAPGGAGGGMGSGLCGVGCGQPSMAWIGRGPGSSGLGAARSAQGR